ncbi:RICIN domain-containing protein [Kitasatospora sp. NPDC059327]|uniref:RICIN domain-containing protein n=1 Tax=Kitasatospora sp. NPDC059327 TaxID=3346803 RepID=UPI0036AA9605
MNDRTSVRHRFGPTAAVLALAAGLALATPAGEARAATSAPFAIGNLATYKCLEVADWRTDNGAPVREWTCTGGDNQQWVWTDADELVNVHSGKCLEIPAYRTDPGAPAGQWDCNGGLNQAWSDADRLHSGLRHLVNRHSGRYLDVAGASTADGAPVIQWDLNGGYNQVWYYSPFPPGPHH